MIANLFREEEESRPPCVALMCSLRGLALTLGAHFGACPAATEKQAVPFWPRNSFPFFPAVPPGLARKNLFLFGERSHRLGFPPRIRIMPAPLSIVSGFKNHLSSRICGSLLPLILPPKIALGCPWRSRPEIPRNFVPFPPGDHARMVSRGVLPTSVGGATDRGWVAIPLILSRAPNQAKQTTETPRRRMDYFFCPSAHGR